MNSETGKYIIAFGVLIVVAGLIVYFFHDKLHWIGKLPGDIRVEKENFRFLFSIDNNDHFQPAPYTGNSPLQKVLTAMG